MRYLTLAEALLIAADVTGINVDTLTRASQLGLLDSALHAPASGIGEIEFHPDFFGKAAILGVRIALNNPLIDGNKRLAWAAVQVFCDINGVKLKFREKDAVKVMIRIASKRMGADEFAEWLRVRTKPIWYSSLVSFWQANLRAMLRILQFRPRG